MLMIKKAFAAAFPKTLPILAGFSFLGFSYGVYMNVSGFSFVYLMLMSLTAAYTGKAPVLRNSHARQVQGHGA